MRRGRFIGDCASAACGFQVSATGSGQGHFEGVAAGQAIPATEGTDRG
jgi:hypothetical protein